MKFSLLQISDVVNKCRLLIRLHFLCEISSVTNFVVVFVAFSLLQIPLSVLFLLGLQSVTNFVTFFLNEVSPVTHFIEMSSVNTFAFFM